MISQGIDIIETKRIQKAIDRFGERFLNKIYTSFEREICDKNSPLRIQRYAAYWAVKEATMKALGTGHRKGVIYKHIEVVHEPSGKPLLNLYGRAESVSVKMGVNEMAVSMSHLEDLAVAVVTFV